MPVARYIVWVGTSLLVLLFVANWFLPQPPPEPAHEASDKPVIRILLPSCASDHARDRPICGNRVGQSELFLESTARHRRDEGQHPLGTRPRPREREFSVWNVRRTNVGFAPEAAGPLESGFDHFGNRGEYAVSPVLAFPGSP